MAKDIIFNEEARRKIKEGIDAVADAVKITIGPFGRNVVLQKSYGGPTITNDGVSIARDISLKDPYKQIGVELIKEVANKTNDVAGDGTSTSIVLTQAMVEEGIKQIEKGVNVLSIRRGMEKAHKRAEQLLDEMKQEVGTNDRMIERVAAVSVEDEEKGKIIAETVRKVGKDGVVTVEESQLIGIESDVVEGLEIDRGYISPYMMTSPDRLEAEYKDVPVLVTDKKVSSVKEFLPFLEKLAQTGKKDLVIVAEDIEGEALTTFVVNKLRGTFNVLGVKAPGFGDRKKENLQDLAVTIGAEVVSGDAGMSFETIGLDVLGTAARVVSKKDSTVFVGSKETEMRVKERVSELKHLLDQTDGKFDKEKLQERIAKLSGGVAVLRVGAATEAEMKYLKLKIEDAVNATKVALDDGIIPGGGAALVYIANILRGETQSTQWSDEFEKRGYLIVTAALEAPLRQITDNALGFGEGTSVVRSVQKKGDKRCGYDVRSQKIVDDLIEHGIIDPVQVAKSGLNHAVSTVSTFLTTEAAVVEIPEEKDSNSPGAPDMGGMGGMY